ncbi:hypothetical protein Musp01_05950 [Muricauda sp. NBRC 101325]|nr:hypothetical protein Musp01_05950 [Muricauda sp. NBRC 101325]
MIILRKWWIRAIISLLLGGVVTELGYLYTDGDIELNSLIPAFGIFVFLTIVYMLILQRQIKKFK